MNDAFAVLCDIVSRDNAVMLTGAGISTGLKREDGGRLPSWPQLLREILAKMKSDIPSEDLDDCLRLIEGDPPGTRLIEAASILSAHDSERFREHLKAAVTPIPGQYSDTHRAIVSTRPRGIVTFNYDHAHEDSTKHIETVVLTPTDESAIRGILGSGEKRLFILKAHGTLEKGELTLTYESYRNLLSKNPLYRAFVQHLLTNHSLVIVGFGMVDPDFDLFLGNMASIYGSPIQQHVLIRHVKSKSGQDVELRRRYGIHTLYVNDHAEIPETLERAAETPGPWLNGVLQASIEAPMKERQAAHVQLRKLGPAGRTSAIAALRRRLTTESHPGHLSEIAYTLGIIDAEAAKMDLIRIVDEAEHAAPAARALTVLRQVLVPADLIKVEEWLNRFRREPLAGERIRRLPTYCEYLRVYVQAKYDSEADLRT